MNRIARVVSWFVVGLVVGRVLCGCTCDRSHDGNDVAELHDAAELHDVDVVPVDVDVAELLRCDPCARVAECCAPAWGPGCAAVLLDVDGTLTRCRASFAARPCATSCADPAVVPCETIRAGAIRWCE